jgi:hypothetical protein
MVRAKKKPPRFVIQVVATGSDKTGVVQSVYFVMPDGSHAEGTCIMTTGKCGLESFAPEKRKTFICGPRGSEHPPICFAPEAFYAFREGNDITILDASGPSKIYHIVGSFDDSDLKPWP